MIMSDAFPRHGEVYIESIVGSLIEHYIVDVKWRIIQKISVLPQKAVHTVTHKSSVQKATELVHSATLVL